MKESKITCKDCGKENPEFFMVYDEMWEQYIPEQERDIIICQECFEKRIGHNLEHNDFTFAPLNHHLKTQDELEQFNVWEKLANEVGGTIETNSLTYHLWFYKNRMLIGLDDSNNVVVKINSENLDKLSEMIIEKPTSFIFTGYLTGLLKNIKGLKNDN